MFVSELKDYNDIVHSFELSNEICIKSVYLPCPGIDLLKFWFTISDCLNSLVLFCCVFQQLRIDTEIFSQTTSRLQRVN